MRAFEKKIGARAGVHFSEAIFGSQFADTSIKEDMSANEEEQQHSRCDKLLERTLRNSMRTLAPNILC